MRNSHVFVFEARRAWCARKFAEVRERHPVRIQFRNALLHLYQWRHHVTHLITPEGTVQAGGARRNERGGTVQAGGGGRRRAGAAQVERSR